MTEEKEDKNSDMSKKEAMEEELSRTLLESEFEQKDPEQQAVEHLLPRWEIRTMAELDPIVEETMEVRKYVKEVDDRYNVYLKKAGLLKDEAKSSDEQ